MKKFFIFAAAAALLVACEKPCENCNQFVEVGGVAYRTVTLANGQTWMAENLRVVPEGMTVSSDANQGTIWYPAAPGKGAALTDEASVKNLGYLYDIFTALKIDRVKSGVNAKVEEYKTAAEADDAAKMSQVITDIENILSVYEGKQGICPDGWHVPTATELQNAFGSSIVGGGDTIVENAPFFDTTYNKGKVSKTIGSGFNFTFPGYVNISMLKVSGYATNIIGLKEGDPEKVWQSPIAEWNGQNSVNCFISSTYKGSLTSKKDKAISNIQFTGAMTTFSKTFSEGAVMLSSLNATSGYSVRCVKNN